MIADRKRRRSDIRLAAVLCLFCSCSRQADRVVPKPLEKAGGSHATVPAKPIVVRANDPRLHFFGYAKLDVGTNTVTFSRPVDNSPYAADSGGARIVFRTDAGSAVVHLRYALAQDMPEHCYYLSRGCCRVDGTVSDSDRFTRASKDGGNIDVSVTAKESGGIHCYEVVLPQADKVDFLGITLTPGSTLYPADPGPEMRYAAYGDSITQGFWTESPLDGYPERVAYTMGWKSVNLGFSGRLCVPEDAKLIAGVKPDVVSVLIGANDCLTDISLQLFADNFRLLLYGIRAHGFSGPIFVITPLAVAGGKWTAGTERLEDYRERIRAVVRERNDEAVHLVEGADLVPADNRYFRDGLHPNADGFKVIAENLVKRLKMVTGVNIAGKLREFTGARTRVAWCRQVAGDWSDTFAVGRDLKLMGLDTDDGKGVREILPEVSCYHKPLISPAATRIVFSDYPDKKVFCVNWDGSGLRELASGLATEVWIDPRTGVEWVYIITGEIDEAAAYAGKPVIRFQLDDPSVQEMVWNKTPVSGDSFQLSADGKCASGLFPWPAAGIADLTRGTWKRLVRKGCWTSMAPDNSYLFWAFDGLHRNVTVFSPEQPRGWTVPINTAPDIGRYEVYHPRWSNHVRFMCTTGPYKGGEGANRIGAGGRMVEVYLGKFAADFSAVEKWINVTEENLPDFFPDVWVEKGVGGDAQTTTTSAGSSDIRPRQTREGRLMIRAELVDATPIPSPKQLVFYRSALVVHTYEVRKVLKGDFKGRRLMVSHWVIRDGKMLPVKWQLGREYDLTVERFDDHPELEGERVILDVEELDLPLYYDVESGKTDGRGKGWEVGN